MVECGCGGSGVGVAEIPVRCGCGGRDRSGDMYRRH